MKTAKPKYLLSMIIVGSIGLFVRILPFTSSQIALMRGLIGFLFVLIVALISKQELSLKRIKPDFFILLLSGAAIGINWILLFQSYHYTTISNATICYYFAPVIVVFLSPFILKEKLTLLSVLCILAALLGIFFIAGSGERGSNDFIGILYGLGAAVFYASVILLNKFLHHVSNIERTLLQLGFATVSLLPYVAFTTTYDFGLFSTQNIILLLFVGIVHTGFAYFLYFSGLHELKGNTIALLSYIDPLTAILLSTVLLHEPIGMWQILGGILILGSALTNDILGKESPT